jgi:hypothetical protein
MSEPDAKSERMALRQKAPPLVERRSSVRTLLRDVRGTMSWRGDTGDIACDVVVLNISGGGAAILADDAPRAGQALHLSLHCDAARMGLIEGQVIEARPDSSGKQAVHVRFAHWVPLDSLLASHRERRLWERYPTRESRASLGWLEGSTEVAIRGELLNISGGGAAFASDLLPPRGVPIWLWLEAGVREGMRIHAVESRLVATSVDPSGMRIAHLQFVDPCPMDLFELTVDGPG